MVPAARWLVVALLVVAVASPPTLLRLRPADQSTLSAAQVLARVKKSERSGWSGEVRAVGSLSVPLAGSTFGGISRLLGGQTDLRVWWKDSQTWRVDRMRTTGETDLVRDGGLSVQWNYEDNRVRFTPYSPIRLPNDSDVVPSSLATRMLAGAKASELSRLPAERVAGRSAAGLRLRPADTRSTISRVDLWSDDETGLPLRVQVYGDPTVRTPVLTTELVTVDMDDPSKAQTDFELSPTLDFSRGVALDDAAGANAYAPFVPPDSLAGLPRRGKPADFGAVGVYGRGPTAVLAVPLRDSVSGGLRTQLRKASNARTIGRTTSLEVGPLSVLLVDARRGNFLLTGTVTPQTLTQAAIELGRNVRRTD